MQMVERLFRTCEHKPTRETPLSQMFTLLGNASPSALSLETEFHPSIGQSVRSALHEPCSYSVDSRDPRCESFGAFDGFGRSVELDTWFNSFVESRAPSAECSHENIFLLSCRDLSHSGVVSYSSKENKRRRVTRHLY